MNFIDTCCRICANFETSMKFNDIFCSHLVDEHKFPDGKPLAEAYSDVTKIKCSGNDGLPRVICDSCETRLIEAYYLWYQAIESHEKLIAIKKCRNAEVISDSSNLIHPQSSSFTGIAQIKDANKQDAVSFLLSTYSDSIENSSIDDEAIVNLKTDNNDTSSLIEIAERFDQNQMEIQQINNKNRRFECEICAKKFLRKSNLNDHIRMHNNIRMYGCEICDKKFVQIGNLQSHIRTHTAERPFICSYCPKTYNQSSALKVHIRSHTNERNYICNVCSKAFTNTSDLSKHKRIHDTNLQFKCTVCNKFFAQKCNLLNHKCMKLLIEKINENKM